MTAWTKPLKSALLALILPIALAGCGVNTIPTEEEQAKTAWADVQAQYQRRSDLIPNLVATVQGYANQEKSVLVQVTQARASAGRIPAADASTPSDPVKFRAYEQAQNQLSVALTPFRVMQENYPNLQSNQNFIALQSQLEGTENRIAIARRDYNEAVRIYNTELHTFPGVIWAGTLYKNEKPMELFAASEAAQTAPKVNFAPPANQ